MSPSLVVSFTIKNIPLDENGLPTQYHTQMECIRYAIDKIMYAIFKTKDGDELASIPTSIIFCPGGNIRSSQNIVYNSEGAIDAKRIDEEVQRENERSSG